MQIRNHTTELINERYSYWAAKGLTGAQIYEALATDEKLPTLLDPDTAAAAADLSSFGLKIRRQRKQEPAYIALSLKKVVYGRADFFRWLAGRCN